MDYKFDRRDSKLLLSRLNYYSVGAYIIGNITRKRYLKEEKSLHAQIRTK